MTENFKPYLFDSSAWIEWFLGTPHGTRVQQIVDSDTTIITLSPILGEIFWWALKNNQDFQLILPLIRQRSRIIDPTANHWVEAAHKKFLLRPKKTKIGLIDTLLLSFQDMTGATLVTKDNDFRGLPNTIML